MILPIDSTAAEEAVLHAQRIIDFFSKDLSNRMCMTQIPIALYLEAEAHKDRIKGFDEAAYTNEVALSQVDDDVQKFNQTPLAQAIRRRAGNNCLNCKLEIPKLDINGMLSEAMRDIKAYLKVVAGAFNPLRISKALPDLAYLLSYICIPDLLKLLAVILAAIMSILATIVIASFSLMGFIMAIITKIISALFRYIKIMTNFAMTPIQCILNALDTLIDTIPTPYNISQQLNDANRQTFNQITGASIDKNEQPNTYEAAIEQLKLKQKKTSAAIDETIKDQFSSITNTINSAVEDFVEQIEKLLGMKTHFECEARRNGTTLSDSIERIMTLIAIANLIKSLVKKKVKKSSRNVLQQKRYPGGTFSDINDELSTSDIADALSNALGKQVAVATSGDTDVGVFISDNDTNNLDDTLSIFSCSLIEFAEGANLDNIIADIADVDESILLDDGLDPVIPRIPVEQIANDLGTKPGVFIEFSTDPNRPIISDIKSIIDFIGVYNPYVEAGQSTDGTSNNDGNKFPTDTAPVTSNTGSGSGVVQTQTQSGTIRGGISNTYRTKPLSLECGTVDDISAKLSQLS